MNQERYKTWQEFYKAAAESGAIRKMLDQPYADWMTARDLNITVIYTLGDATQSAIAAVYGISTSAVLLAIRRTNQRIWEHLPEQDRQLYPDLSQIRYRQVVPFSKEKKAPDYNYFDEFAHQLRGAGADEEIQEALDQIASSPYKTIIRYRRMQPPLVYFTKDVIIRSGLRYAPTLVPGYVDVLKEKGVPISTAERVVQSSGKQVIQRHHILAAQNLTRACQALLSYQPLV